MSSMMFLDQMTVGVQGFFITFVSVVLGSKLHPSSQLATWFSGIILALGARGRGFDSRSRPRSLGLVV